jgi:uncharacterized protein
VRLSLDHEIRDPIHGLIRLTDQEMRLVNTSVFQRLRRVRQLAMADLVYPGALHTRFDHSLGVVQLAQRVLERLDRIEQMIDTDAQVVRLAALLHDVGHGPFSHVSEYVLDRHYDKAAVGTAADRAKIHEKLTVDIINKHPEITAVLDGEQRTAVVALIQGARQRDFRRDIVSSALDADKMDYLLRDAYYAGVRYGQYDLEKIIDACRVRREGTQSYLVVDESGIFAVEQLILSKHHMFQQVYGHRVRVITDAMIVRGLELAIETDEAVREAYAYDGSDEHLARYLATDDAEIVHSVMQSEATRAKSIFQRLRDRRLLKEVALITLDERGVRSATLRDRLSRLTDEQMRQIEQEIAERLGWQPWEVIVHKHSVKNPAYRQPGVFDPEEIYVQTRAGDTRKLSDFGELVQARLSATERVRVIGPWQAPEGQTAEGARKARAELAEVVRKQVEAIVGGF